MPLEIHSATVPAGKATVSAYWRISGAVKGGRRSLRYVLTDTNYRKSLVHARLAVAMGDAGCLSLIAGHHHRLLAERSTSEYRVKPTRRGGVGG